WLPAGGNAAAASSLTPGSYTCTVTDANGCMVTSTVTIANTGSVPVAALTSSSGTSFCGGTSDTLTASGGGTYSWNTSATTSSIVVNTAGTYVVHVSNACGSDSTTVTLTVKPLPNPVITGASGMCAGDSVLLSASGGTSYSWSPVSSTASTIWVHNGGTYTVTATNSCGSTTASTAVTLNTISASFSASDTTGPYPLPVTFTNGSSASATTWSWNMGDGTTSTSQNPNDTYTSPGTYTVTLTATNAQGCTSTYTEIIHVGEIPSFITVPNVFTPNGDGVNDMFYVNYAGITQFDCKIYDRWGVAMAQLTGPGEPWDGHTMSGEMANMGTYFYEIHATGDDGKTYNMTGFITLLRQ
ncbi:MAG TPA: gliding motility-associated C-terminal domain-containing protein, partial [Bacteroidia bacterium]|nr:gliding motility-associated C-terminal domain-containing protein [Bacteroidia bacterium]